MQQLIGKDELAAANLTDSHLYQAQHIDCDANDLVLPEEAAHAGVKVDSHSKTCNANEEPKQL